MGEETSDAMNLDLNLGPGPEPASATMSIEPVNLENWIDQQPIHQIAEAYGINPFRRRWPQPEAHNVSSELSQLMVDSGTSSILQAGEGSVAAEERSNDVPKKCENINGILENETSEEKDDVEKSSGNDGSFFDCNICLDLARDPVLTCCGHLFCWPCLYRWLHVHSDAKECPVCKGEVTLKNVTPIYGRGNNAREPDDDSNLKIPLRPHARRVESLRQTIQRNAFTFPVEEMIRRLGSRFDLSRDLVQPTEDTPRETAAERTNGLLNRILTSRALRREQIQLAQTEIVDLTQDNITSLDTGDNRRLQSMLLRRTQSHRATLSSLSSALSSAERLVEAYFHNHPITPAVRNQEPPPPVDDRDSFSSIQAVINSESQMDTAVEIDSMVSLSTSSSRRRNEASRVSDMDSGDSRAPRRRRLN
ncbi:putative aminoacyltransferase, E1 ubiquitin-activating enzyme [Rosa chinensis]|uniref:E3 ubiquitin-protein ligase RMA n=1 Tax=Rosa chinensis TaxID=74649 RepID=A0A2P6RDC1_ROSCH|nr:ORC ubiquitin ligase 1 [Rosa chinensis]PRQ44449.1 putative aminoacyltransferase, E1 ubiquitin-activating enzyme [Rosa chinensis]